MKHVLEAQKGVPVCAIDILRAFADELRVAGSVILSEAANCLDRAIDRTATSPPVEPVAPRAGMRVRWDWFRPGVGSIVERDGHLTIHYDDGTSMSSDLRSQCGRAWWDDVIRAGDLRVLPDPAPAAEVAAPLPCGDRSDNGYVCTLPAGHPSAHADWTGSIAGRDVAPRAMWPYWPGVSEPDDAPSVPPVAWVEIDSDGAAVGATSSEAERDDLMRDGWRIVEYVPRSALDAMRAERDEARRQAAEAYERAAKVCDDYANRVRWREEATGALECASRIRALTAKGGAR